MSELTTRFKKIEETKKWENEDVGEFIKEMKKGLYPNKCLICYKSGLRYCGFWEANFNCEEIEEGEIGSIFKKYIARAKK